MGEKADEARRLFEAQTARDIRHHQRRVKWLESLPKLDRLHTEMLRQSREVLEKPFLGYNTGPQSDEEEAKYLEEGDEDDENETI